MNETDKYIKVVVLFDIIKTNNDDYYATYSSQTYNILKGPPDAGGGASKYNIPRKNNKIIYNRGSSRKMHERGTNSKTFRRH